MRFLPFLGPNDRSLSYLKLSFEVRIIYNEEELWDLILHDWYLPMYSDDFHNFFEGIVEQS